MITTLFAKKLGMGEIYEGDTRHGATQIELYPMQVSALKTSEKDGYSAVQVTFGLSPKKVTKARAGHLKASSATGKFSREIRTNETLELGAQLLPADLLQVGAMTNITGTSKGKGLAGVVKLHNFAGGPRTHGQSDRLRRAGSIGQGTTPGRIYKGKKMAGRMGNQSVTVKNAKVVSFDPTTNIAWVKGAVPGHTGSLLTLTLSGNKKD